MNLTMPELDLLGEHGTDLVDDVRAQVLGLLSALYPRNDLIERRQDTRYPFPCLVRLTPVEADGEALDEEPIFVVGKHISEQGLGFYHPNPLPYRHVIASVECGDNRQFAFLMDLTWCRFTKEGWYESGGRFLQAVSAP